MQPLNLQNPPKPPKAVDDERYTWIPYKNKTHDSFRNVVLFLESDMTLSNLQDMLYRHNNYVTPDRP